MLLVFGGEVLGSLGPPPSVHLVKNMPGIVNEFHGKFLLIIWVLDVVAALVGFPVLNLIGCPSIMDQGLVSNFMFLFHLSFASHH